MDPAGHSMKILRRNFGEMIPSMVLRGATTGPSSAIPHPGGTPS
jgi:hypothetical protein